MAPTRPAVRLIFGSIFLDFMCSTAHMGQNLPILLNQMVLHRSRLCLRIWFFDMRYRSNFNNLDLWESDRGSRCRRYLQRWPHYHRLLCTLGETTSTHGGIRCNVWDSFGSWTFVGRNLHCETLLAMVLLSQFADWCNYASHCRLPRQSESSQADTLSQRTTS